MSAEAHKIRLPTTLRRPGATDARVLCAIERTPREIFGPPAFQDQARKDPAPPVDNEQTTGRPPVVALTTQAPDVRDRRRVLEIGAGSGYQASSSRLRRRLYGVKRIRPLLRQAEERFRTLKINNITTRLGDGAGGRPEAAPFERITAAAAGGAEPPAGLSAQPPAGGKTPVSPGGECGEQRVCRIVRREDGTPDQEARRPVRFAPLVSDARAVGKRARTA